MKRFHVHLSVTDLAVNIRFYSSLFGAEPTVSKADYAKWMLDDPRINFAISSRSADVGLNHLGFQVDAAEELATLHEQVSRASEAATTALIEQNEAACCYAMSNKYWNTDPQGIAWETFQTLDVIPVFGESDALPTDHTAKSACCVPLAPAKMAAAELPATGSTATPCCVPSAAPKAGGACC